MREATRIIIVATGTQFLDHVNGRIVLLGILFLSLVDDKFFQFHTRRHKVNEYDTTLPRLDFHLLGAISHSTDTQLVERGACVDGKSTLVSSERSLAGTDQRYRGIGDALVR